jgi:hypothetical protein
VLDKFCVFGNCELLPVEELILKFECHDTNLTEGVTFAVFQNFRATAILELMIEKA